MYESGELKFDLEKDIRDRLFTDCVESGSTHGLPKGEAHYEYDLNDMTPDLYFEGGTPLAVELKYVKKDSGGYTDTQAGFRADAKKLRRYTKMGCTAYLLVTDESTYFARPDRKNHFNPSDFGLEGEWRRLKNGAYTLVAKYPWKRRSPHWTTTLRLSSPCPHPPSPNTRIPPEALPRPRGLSNDVEARGL